MWRVVIFALSVEMRRDLIRFRRRAGAWFTRRPATR